MFDLDRCALVGMVHLIPLPGSPGWGGSTNAVLDAALRDARALIEGGIDAIIVENMGDVPYLRGRVEPETVAAAEIAIWADVQKKHSSHAVTADLDLAELAHGTAFCGADALIVTGSRTGAATSLEDVQAAKSAGLPVVVGSGVTPQDAATLAAEADALIVGSWLKQSGNWRDAVDAERVRTLRNAMLGQ
jgi:predicted TIM-barrel enzyme